MPTENQKHSSMSDLLAESKKCYRLQKEYMRYSAAEQSTRILSTLTIVAVVAIVAIIVFIFLGLAIVHWLNDVISNTGLCYAIYALFLLIILSIFYVNRRKWVILPFARRMTKLFIKEDEEEEEVEDD